ncbi:type II toxin-antitoxin system mRNA interferase toxin, RelE/StbE family [Candidatus Woesearchaeota archaeon]|nr:type II toxin-antitoxin system mRNA interferase toxin, RelE/StbE family [Candidatus Woesearchaeota archaeon]
MYEIYPANKRVEKKLEEIKNSRNDVFEKLKNLKENPRENSGAHPLHGRLQGKWACWLGSNLRIIYIIDDKSKRIDVLAAGSHKVY